MASNSLYMTKQNNNYGGTAHTVLTTDQPQWIHATHLKRAPWNSQPRNKDLEVQTSDPIRISLSVCGVVWCGVVCVCV